MRSSQSLFTACGLLLVLGSFAGPAPAAPPAKPSAAKPAAPAASTAKADEPFVETVNVGVVNVDVYVTDKKGNPVTGLAKNDFQLLENDRPVEITNFYAVNNGKSVTPLTSIETAATAPAPGAPPSPAEMEKIQTPEDQRLRLIVYIDNYNLRPFNRNRVMRELRAFIGQNLGKDDLMMLATYDRELHIRHTFTSDPSLIAAGMLDIEKIGRSRDEIRGELPTPTAATCCRRSPTRRASPRPKRSPTATPRTPSTTCRSRSTPSRRWSMRWPACQGARRWSTSATACR